MAWRDEILSSLPAPRGDEPASLRRDIEDELADHLHCAMQRERVTAHDDETARRAVLARFGNPRRVAYRLWWDAMKEKIMKDRLMIAASVVMMVTCILAVGALWLTLKENREVNAALLAQIRDLASRPVAGTSASNQATLKIKMVMTKPQGKPVAGIDLTLEGYPFSETRNEIIKLTTNNEGVATVGPIRAGRYRIQCNAPHGFDEWILLYEGQSLEKNIICPEDLTTTPTAARFTVDWPKKLIEPLDLARLPKGEDVYLLGRLYDNGMKLGSTMWGGDQIDFLISSHGEITKSFKFANGSVMIPAPGDFSTSISVPRGNYRLAFLYLARGQYGARVDFTAQMDFKAGAEPQYNVTGNSPANFHLTIPEAMQEQILEKNPMEKTIKLIYGAETQQFRKIAISINRYLNNKSGYYIMVDTREFLPHAMMQALSLTAGQTSTIGDYQITLEKFFDDGAVVHLRYMPGIADLDSRQTQQVPRP